MIILFLRGQGFGQDFYRLGLSVGLSELEFLGQIALVDRRLRGTAQTPLALSYPFCTWPGSSMWAERDNREARNILVFERYTPEVFLDLGIYMQSLNENTWDNVYFQIGITSKSAS